jgi:hypothetical protein
MVYIAIYYIIYIHGTSTLEKQTLNLGQRLVIHTFDPIDGRSTLMALNLDVKSNMVYIAIYYIIHIHVLLYWVKVPQSGPST